MNVKGRSLWKLNLLEVSTLDVRNVGLYIQMTKYCFGEDLALSHKYETKFADWLTKIGIPEVKTMQDKGEFHDYDVESFDMTYEIKYDRYMAKTGNFCLETVSRKETNSQGWFYKTKADWIVVFFNETEFVTIKKTDLAENWFEKPKIWKRIEVKRKKNATSICWLADVKDLEGLKVMGIDDMVK